jgi:signal transduction histidine kinase
VTPDQLKRIGVIDSQIGRVVRIIEDLLTSTRQRKPVLIPLPVDHLVESVVSLMQPAFVGKGVSLLRNIVPVGLSVRGDAEQLQQVLINLLTNALAATSEGGEVEIVVHRQESGTVEHESRESVVQPDEAPMVVLSVRDTGCGMPEEHIGRAFEPFFTTKAIGRGTGLGLFLSRQIVSSHGGSLSIDSRLGEGTTVIVRLPQCEASEAAEVGQVSHGG